MRFRRLLGTLAALTLTCSGAQAQILNGSFETTSPGGLVSPGSFVRVFAGDSTSIANWTVLGSDVLLMSTSYAEPGNGINQFNAQNGNLHVDLTGLGNTGTTNGVQQIINTVIGQTYRLDFYVGRASGNGPFYAADAIVGVSINGAARTNYTNSASTPGLVNWALRSHIFQATSTSTTVAFLNSTPPVTAYAGVDNVSITAIAAIPEPGTITLAAVGLPFLALAAWRRRRGA